MTPPCWAKQRHRLEHTGWELSARLSEVSHRTGSRMRQGIKLAKAHTTTDHGNLDPSTTLFVHSNSWQLLIPNHRRNPVMQIMHTVVAVMRTLHSTSLLQSCSTGQLLFQKRCSNSRNIAHLIYHLLFIQLPHKGHLQHWRWDEIVPFVDSPGCYFTVICVSCFKTLVLGPSQGLQPHSVATCYKHQYSDATACSVCLAVLPALCPQLPCPLLQILTWIWRLQICRQIPGKTNLETNFDKMPLCGTGILIEINTTSPTCIPSLLSFHCPKVNI